MLQRQKGPQWWYKVKSIAKKAFENPKSKVWIFFWAVILATNFLFTEFSDYMNRPYTSEEKILGIPVFTTEPFRFALISVSGISFGIISLGGISLGLFSVGGVCLGWLALGGLALGYFCLGGGAFGYYSIGGLAVGGYAYAGGGVALGIYEAEGKQKEKLLRMKPYQEPLYKKS
jgi:hypothetical protein